MRLATARIRRSGRQAAKKNGIAMEKQRDLTASGGPLVFGPRSMRSERTAVRAKRTAGDCRHITWIRQIIRKF